MRPRPSNYVAWGSTDFLIKLYQNAKNMDLIKRDSKWTLVFEDFQSEKFLKSSLMDLSNRIEMSSQSCCIIQDISSGKLLNIMFPLKAKSFKKSKFTFSNLTISDMTWP